MEWLEAGPIRPPFNLFAILCDVLVHLAFFILRFATGCLRAMQKEEPKLKESLRVAWEGANRSTEVCSLVLITSLEQLDGYADRRLVVVHKRVHARVCVPLSACAFMAVCACMWWWWCVFVCVCGGGGRGQGEVRGYSTPALLASVLNSNHIHQLSGKGA